VSNLSNQPHFQPVANRAGISPKAVHGWQPVTALKTRNARLGGPHSARHLSLAQACPIPCGDQLARHGEFRFERVIRLLEFGIALPFPFQLTN
jgi:hypothetical protein